MLDFRIDTFLTVCKYMNFTKAAEKLSITQPAVSQHIKYLEMNYKTKLFEYCGKRMRLTESGIVLLNAATTLKHDEIHLREQLKEMKREKRKLVFGVTLTIGEFIIPVHISSYLKKFPDAKVKIVVSNTKNLLMQMDSGEIDFALIEGFFEKREYDYLVYSRENYTAVCAKEYCFKKKAQEIEDLLGERLIIREDGSGTREIIERYLEERNLTLHDFDNLVEINNIRAIKTLVECGCGITFLYKAAVEKELREGVLQEIVLKDFQIQHDLNFVWRKDSIFSDYYEELFQLLQK